MISNSLILLFKEVDLYLLSPSNIVSYLLSI